MTAKVFCAAIVGLEAQAIEVEADVSNGLPATIIVGLPDASVQESKERVKSAVKNSGSNYPSTRVSVNLAPADLPKLGTHFDLPIALAILLSAGQASFNPDGKMFLGELSLDGKLRGVSGTLAITIKAKELGFDEIFIPMTNAREAALVEGIKVYATENLQSLIEHLQGVKVLKEEPLVEVSQVLMNIRTGLDMKDIAGQEMAKRALEIAAAGGH
ncbi:MAG: magnesium chelatase, partial [Candidatus Doudnabacteria bacterium CG10_big_fil_rev_8_21_14_0_10_42_18]